MNIIIITLIFSNINTEKIKMPGFNFVAATLDAACDNYIDQTNDICEKVAVIVWPVDVLRTPEEEAVAECCSDEDFGLGPQEYCWAENGQAYCGGNSCQCKANRATPASEGQAYGVASSNDCYTTEKYSGGKCWYQVPEFVIEPWDYNQALKSEPGVNVYVREEKVWFLDPKGYLIPAKITITVW